MATMAQLLAANKKTAIVIAVMLCVGAALTITAIVYLRKLHHPRGPRRYPLPTLTLSFISSANSSSSSWPFYASISDPYHLNHSLAFVPLFYYKNTTSNQPIGSIIGTVLQFYPNRRQSTFSGILNLDLVRADVLPFFQAQLASGTVQAGINVGTRLDDGRALSWGCRTLLRTGYASLPIRCRPQVVGN